MLIIINKADKLQKKFIEKATRPSEQPIGF